MRNGNGPSGGEEADDAVEEGEDVRVAGQGLLHGDEVDGRAVGLDWGVVGVEELGGVDLWWCMWLGWWEILMELKMLGAAVEAGLEDAEKTLGRLEPLLDVVGPRVSVIGRQQTVQAALQLDQSVCQGRGWWGCCCCCWYWSWHRCAVVGLGVVGGVRRRQVAISQPGAVAEQSCMCRRMSFFKKAILLKSSSGGVVDVDTPVEIG